MNVINTVTFIRKLKKEIYQFQIRKSVKAIEMPEHKYIVICRGSRNGDLRQRS